MNRSIHKKTILPWHNAWQLDCVTECAPFAWSARKKPQRGKRRARSEERRKRRKRRWRTDKGEGRKKGGKGVQSRVKCKG
jgi:hypothetical protein